MQCSSIIKKSSPVQLTFNLTISKYNLLTNLQILRPIVFVYWFTRTQNKATRRIIRSAVRVVYNIPHCEKTNDISITQLMKKLSVNDRINYKIIPRFIIPRFIMMYK